MWSPSRRGATLPELLVSLLLLAIGASAWLTAAVAAIRLDRAARSRAATDQARLDTVALRAASPACRQAATPDSGVLLLPARAGRPARSVTYRCGR